MKTRSLVPTIAVLLGGASLMFASPAFAVETPAPSDPAAAVVEPKDQVCEEGDSGKIDLSGDDVTFEITAEPGYVITEYCVKAGSIEQGDGPEYYVVDPPQESVVIEHSTGKGISHYSFIQELIPTPTPTPTPEPTPTPTTPPAGGGDGGAKLAETGFDAGWLPFAGIGLLALGAALFVPRLIAKRR
jgi:LPXTG-motif cell wall-anchored protein